MTACRSSTQTIETYAAISRASYSANQEISAGITQNFHQRNASLDRGQRDFVNHVHDQQDYADPSVNGNVTLPPSYNQVFSNGRGDYVLTNDASFRPDPDWTAIEHARYARPFRPSRRHWRCVMSTAGRVHSAQIPAMRRSIAARQQSRSATNLTTLSFRCSLVPQERARAAPPAK